MSTLPAPASLVQYEYEDGYLSDGNEKLQVTFWTLKSGETSACYLKPIDDAQTRFQLFFPDGSPAKIDAENVTISSDADGKTISETFRYFDGEIIREITETIARVTLPDDKPILTYQQKILIPSYLSDASGRLVDAIGYAETDAVSGGNRILRRTGDERDGTPVNLADLAGLDEKDFANVPVRRQIPGGADVETTLKEAAIGLKSLTAPNFDVFAQARRASDAQSPSQTGDTPDAGKAES